MRSSPAILYVEDEETDLLLLRLAFKRAGLSNLISSAVDGVEAIDYLAGNGPFADRQQHPLPGLLLLDLNLPRKNGFEVLQWIREQPQFASLPVLVYTSSSQEADRNEAHRLGATDYIVKRSDVNQIAEFARDLSRRWLTQTTPP